MLRFDLRAARWFYILWQKFLSLLRSLLEKQNAFVSQKSTSEHVASRENDLLCGI